MIILRIVLYRYILYLAYIWLSVEKNVNSVWYISSTIIPVFLFTTSTFHQKNKKKSNFLSIRNPRLISLFFCVWENDGSSIQEVWVFSLFFFLIFHAGLTFYESRSNLPIFLKVAEMGSLGRHSRHQVAYIQHTKELLARII